MERLQRRTVKRCRPGHVLGAALAIAVAFAALPSPGLAADPVSPRTARTGEAAEGAAPKPAPRPARPTAQPTKAKKPAAQPDDNIADDLNRREIERLRGQRVASLPTADGAPLPATPAQAAPSGTGSSPASPQRETEAAPVEPAALPGPARGAQQAQAPTADPPPPIVRPPQTGTEPRVAQQTPQPVPVPTRPSGQPPAVTGAPGATPEAPARDFGRNATVGTEQPTLTVETSKAQFVRLRAPASTVFIANPEIADVQVRSPTLIYVYGKRPGTTVLYAVDDRERVILNTVVSVTHQFSRVMQILDRLHPGHGITFTNNDDTVVLGGTATSAVIVEDARRLALQHAGAATKIINNVRVGGSNQVNLRVKVVEVARGALKNLGVNWNAVGSIGNFAFGMVTGTVPLIGSVFPNSVVGVGAPPIFVAGTPPPNAVGGSYRRGNVGVDALIEALATENLLTVLAEPNLTAMSGETASFLAGGEFPVPVPQSTTSSTITIEYKQFGVSLAFTPTIIGNRINLRVRPEVSQLSDAGSISVPLAGGTIVIPALQTRRADTTVELGSGQSFAIAGLLLRTTNQSLSKVPGLGEVPVLGTMFKTDRFNRDETELVIIVTPYLVEPSSTRLATPIDGYQPPSDRARYLYGQTNTPTLPQGQGGPYAAGGQRLIGPVGFMLD